MLMGRNKFFLVGMPGRVETFVVTWFEIDRWVTNGYEILDWCTAPNRYMAGQRMAPDKVLK